jgi:hypothetical protein
MGDDLAASNVNRSYSLAATSIAIHHDTREVRCDSNKREKMNTNSKMRMAAR